MVGAEPEKVKSEVKCRPRSCKIVCLGRGGGFKAVAFFNDAAIRLRGRRRRPPLQLAAALSVFNGAVFCFFFCQVRDESL